jgi:hypothetical protein
MPWGKYGVMALDADQALRGDEMKPSNPALFALSSSKWKGKALFSRVAVEKTALCQNLDDGRTSDWCSCEPEDGLAFFMPSRGQPARTLS